MDNLLFNIPIPSKWTINQVANIIALISAVATVAALWYAFYRNRQQDKKINDLANIVQELAKANIIFKEQTLLERQKMRVLGRPILKISKIEDFEYDRAMQITIVNDGHTAKNIISNSEGNIKVRNYEPADITPNGTLTLFGDLQEDATFFNHAFIMFIKHEDLFGNKYTTAITVFNRKVISSHAFDDEA